MRRNALRDIVAFGMFVLCLQFAGALRAQESRPTLSGTVTGPSGAPIANAKVTAKGVATRQATETQTDSLGHYAFLTLSPGDYEVAVTAEGFNAQSSKVTLASGTPLKSDFGLIAASGAAQAAETTPTKPTAPTLEDLGISPTQAQGTAQDQARLDKRAHMLMMHQRLGLITMVPMIATVFTSFGAGGRSTSTADRWAHMALGSATGDLYFMTAYYAIRAPRIAGTQSKGPIRIHKILAWIHGPGMIATPILGAIAFNQKSKGEHVHGIARAHGPVAIVTAAAFGAALVSVSFKF